MEGQCYKEDKKEGVLGGGGGGVFCGGLNMRYLGRGWGEDVSRIEGLEGIGASGGGVERGDIQARDTITTQKRSRYNTGYIVVQVINNTPRTPPPSASVAEASELDLVMPL